MRILVILSDAYGGRGGIALYNRNVLRALSGHPARPEVVALPRIANGDLGELPEGVQFLLEATNSKARFLRVFAQLLVGPPYDLVVCSHINLLPFATAVAVRSGAKLAMFAYGKEAWTPGKALSNRLVHAVDAVISIRRHTLDRLRAWSGADTVAGFILENAFDLESYGVGGKRPDLVAKYGLGSRRVLLTLGRLDEADHGVDEVLQVLPALLRESPDLVYVVAGSGRHFERLRQKVMQLGLEANVVFTGEVPEADKADHYRLGDVFVMPGSHPTLFDTYPMRFSFLEALACGLPVVATRPVDLEQYEIQLPNIYVDARDGESIKAGIREGFKRASEKSIPAELLHFGFAGFQERLWRVLGQISGGVGALGATAAS